MQSSSRRMAFATPAVLRTSSLHAQPLREAASSYPQRNNEAVQTRRNKSPCMLFNFGNLWSSKEPDTPQKWNWSIGYSYLAHPEKNTGEDAFFVEGNAIGVFDGVSGAFETRGVDPRLYSQTLAANTREFVRELGAQNVVKAAYQAAATNEQIGASTACVVGMDRYARLFGINLGDSGVRIVRGNKLVFRTKEQQHFFNCPYQLGTDSEDALAMGQNVQQKLQAGDWVIVATDGLYDNMSDTDIVAMAAHASDATELADSLGERAAVRAVDKQFVSPFMQAAMQAGVKWEGGKADDITVVVARVEDDESLLSTSLLSTLAEA
ncbi:phosphatase 2C 80 [Gracilariopsis chorda]|uniref:Protein phosphatase n=1 Tax=Gracilariopsis chorda TaxID=448386 RepID=A0A2V3IX88_9FLOR|nr:phosphatase 2C 80 [Gracilariopsis chorda]|eukprot:PXF46719.1 phosphatase 2C 80 [Gracilariopsis chorda]